MDLFDRITFGRLSWSGPPGASDGGGGSGGDDIVGKESDEASAPPPSDGRLRIERRPGVMRLSTVMRRRAAPRRASLRAAVARWPVEVT